MLILPLAAVVGVVAGFALGGRLTGLADLGLRACGLVWAGLALQLGLGLAPLQSLSAGSRFAVVAASYVLVGAWLVVNAVAHSRGRRVALGLLAAGWAMNLAVMAPNGGMPVSASALERIGAPGDLAVEEGHLWKHVPMSPSTVVPWLGDVVPVAFLRSAVSAGDFVMVAGIVALVAAAMAAAGERPPGAVRGRRCRSGRQDPVVQVV